MLCIPGMIMLTGQRSKLSLSRKRRCLHYSSEPTRQVTKTFELNVNGTMKVILHRMESKKDENGDEKLELGREVVSQEEVFDAINDIHRSTGHMGMERTHTHCADKYIPSHKTWFANIVGHAMFVLRQTLLLLLIVEQRSLSTQITGAAVFKWTLWITVTGRCNVPTSMGRSSTGSWQ
jgi:hypothetical protein